MTITERKLNSSFRTTQFLTVGYSKQFSFDRNRNGCGVVLFVMVDKACRELKRDNPPNDTEGIFIELNLRKVKWLLFSASHPPFQSYDYYFCRVSNCLDVFSSTYDRFLLVGNFNAEDFEKTLLIFFEKHNAVNIVKDKTIFKGLDNPN